jgi:hypothetical protein
LNALGNLAANVVSRAISKTTTIPDVLRSDLGAKNNKRE